MYIYIRYTVNDDARGQPRQRNAKEMDCSKSGDALVTCCKKKLCHWHHPKSSCALQVNLIYPVDSCGSLHFPRWENVRRWWGRKSGWDRSELSSGRCDLFSWMQHRSQLPSPQVKKLCVCSVFASGLASTLFFNLNVGTLLPAGLMDRFQPGSYLWCVFQYMIVPALLVVKPVQTNCITIWTYCISVYFV